MKQTIGQLEAVQSGAEKLKQLLLQLDEKSSEMGDILQRLRQQAAEVSSVAEAGYIQERLHRFSALLSDYPAQTGSALKASSVLHRQIDRIMNADLIQYYSPALERRADKLVQSFETRGNQSRDAFAFYKLTNRHRVKILTYTFGGLHFAVSGRVLKTLTGNPHRPPKVMAGGDTVETFPCRGDQFCTDRAQSGKSGMMVVKGSKKCVGLWADRLLTVEDFDTVMDEQENHPLQHALRSSLESVAKHRYIRGRFRFQGKIWYYLQF